ncbi:InlB B-repeat-containing protein [Rhodohalobacter sp.]|uniref:InlB B-repeat-containing protein n=1 Tax=Rhodohalobacter sp. TaxID=1974210 RepID=UPI002ACE47B4|nr:BspA family leucine-rich repeat surface protein [Rhodohalobacter sp.]MDZ7756357.1 BspA family leucine-rich repeat surface protein [Rhodohalobacter sp.]
MVSVDINPSNSGSISPAADSTYNEGENIDLQAIPKEGYVFTTWAGDVTSTDSSLSLTVDKDYNLTANFELKSYELVITTEGEGTVNEKVVQQKSQDYDHGTIVELTANPAQGYKFKEWKGDITGSENPVEITIDDPKDVTAVFQKVTYALNLNITGQGSIVKDPDQQEYEYGSTVNLTASPATGWEFVEWQGDATGTDSTIQLTIDQAKNITAVFVEYSQNQFYLAENGVTIKCEDADIGETGTVNGVTYTKRTTGYLSPITINNAATSCTSDIINMDELFYYERHFNADISHWDVSSVTSMEAMFRDAWDFNQDISHWDVSSVTNMSSMFDNTTAFNIDISSWNVSSVNDMTFMFVDTDSFDVDLGIWTSAV